MPSRGKVVLFFPSYATEEIAPPIALISIAGPLIGTGFEVVLVDSSVTSDYLGAVLEHADDAVALGISIITGPMIREAIEVGRAWKARNPDAPVIMGGWHASILPEQTLAADFVDVVVEKQGEVSMLELCEQLVRGDGHTGVPGTVWEEDGRPVRGVARAHVPIADLPDRMPGYSLIDPDVYAARTGLRWSMYTASHGCPFDCAYCSNASVYGRKLDLMPPERVVEDVSWLVRNHGIDLLGFTDDIFFAFQERTLEIAEGFLRAGLDIDWYIQDRADSWARLSDSEAKLLRRAGLVRVHFGAESGSDDVLQSIDKRSDVARTLQAVDRCRDAGIRSSFGFIFGLPGETEEDLRATVDLIAAIYARSDRADCHTNIFTPYPGSPLWPESIARGVVPPASLEDWIGFFPRVTELPWLQGAAHRRLQDIRLFLRFGYPNVRVGEDRGSLRHRLALRALGPSARWRLQRHHYRAPVEVRGYEAAQRWKPAVRVYERF